MRSYLSHLSCLALLAILPDSNLLRAGTIHATMSVAPAQPGKLNGGYYLLAHVSEEESQVQMLFLVKDAPDEISGFGKQMSKTAHETAEALGHLRDKYPSVHLDQNPLPPIELDVRASIRADKEQQLVDDTSGPEFYRAFLVTQIEAATYASNLASVLSEQETNPQRVKVLRQIAAQWRARREEAFRLLRHY